MVTPINNMKFFLFIISIISIFSQNFKNSTNIRTLNYFFDNKEYSIIDNENEFKIVTKEVIYCFTTPCNFPILDETVINNEDDCNELKKLFGKIFDETDIKEKPLFDEDLTEEELEVFLKILENNINISILKYTIYNRVYCNTQCEKRGYFYKKENDSVIYTIAMGERYSGGYSIGIKKVKIKANSVIVYVYETVPGKYDHVTDGHTYPIVQIKFNHEPDSISIINYETNESFPDLNKLIIQDV